MKKIIFTTLLVTLVATVASAATWKSYYTSNDGNKYLANPLSKITSGDGTEVSMDVMWKFGKPEKYNGIAKTTQTLKANCFDKELRSSNITAYNAKGKVIGKEESTDLEFSSNPVNAAAFKFLCGGN